MRAWFFALDTSCMVAAACGWHVRHAAAASEIERRLDGGDRMAIAARAVVLLTFNRRHFDPPPRGLTIVEPAESD